MRTRRLLPTFALTMAFATTPALVACTNQASTEPGDSPADAGTPTALGNGLRIAEINNPNSSVRPANDQMNVAVTGASFLVADNYAETGLASSVGSVYVQDFHSALDDAGAAPFSGISFYKPTYEPASLQLAPGDVIDFIGEYQEYISTSFPAGQYQPEMYEPIVTFRFDYNPPPPTLINATDLESFAKGYQWMSMLVTVTNTVGGGDSEDGSGRGYVYLTSDTGMTAVTIDNELYNFPWFDPKYATAGKTHFTSVTGIVTYFESFHISPRSDADIQSEPVE